MAVGQMDPLLKAWAEARVKEWRPDLPEPTEAIARADLEQSGLLANLRKRTAFEEQGARRGGFLNAAQRGFTGGGMAAGAAEPLLADVAWESSQREQAAIGARMGQLADERQFNMQMARAKESAALQRDANKPSGLFGWLFG